MSEKEPNEYCRDSFRDQTFKELVANGTLTKEEAKKFGEEVNRSLRQNRGRWTAGVMALGGLAVLAYMGINTLLPATDQSLATATPTSTPRPTATFIPPQRPESGATSTPQVLFVPTSTPYATITPYPAATLSPFLRLGDIT